tara:strand:+ start:3404 stop:3847 length:444 start_codon:yes stop_codon:yes gene_type:complete
MKKLLLVLAMIPVFVIGQQRNKQTFIELNVGIASIDDYDFSLPLPGASVLFGQTIAVSEAMVFEYQVGVAVPSLATGKIAFGYGKVERNIALAIRPWPLTIGPQGKIDNFSFSFEVGNNNEASFDAGFIVTIGYRFIFGRRKKDKDR